jgi:hypothetical protein
LAEDNGHDQGAATLEVLDRNAMDLGYSQGEKRGDLEDTNDLPAGKRESHRGPHPGCSRWATRRCTESRYSSEEVLLQGGDDLGRCRIGSRPTHLVYVVDDLAVLKSQSLVEANSQGFRNSVAFCHRSTSGSSGGSGP